MHQFLVIAYHLPFVLWFVYLFLYFFLFAMGYSFIFTGTVFILFVMCIFCISNEFQRDLKSDNILNHPKS